MNLKAPHLFFAAVALFASACAVQPEESPDATEEPVGTAQSASVKCSGSGCTGQDPGASGCGADGLTQETRNIIDIVSGAQLGTVAFRYSPTCKTSWSHVVSFGTGNTVVAALYENGVPAESTTSTGQVKSKMVYSPCTLGISTQAQGVIDPPGSSYGSAVTSYYCVR